MIRDDVFYTDHESSQIATHSWGGAFMKTSERFATSPALQGLKFSDKDHSLTSDTRETTNLETLMEVLRGTDFDRYEQYKEKFLDDKVSRFLDNTPIQTEKVAYMTFPRSGNTFLRKYIELISGVPTGSEMPVNLLMPLQMSGLIGEEIVDDRCWIIKTHHPNRLKKYDFKANKMLICVRNPFDVMKSYLQFISVMSHSKAVANDLPVEQPKYFKFHQKALLKIFSNFARETLRLAKDK
mmetsp:Transcript_3401/g.5104  ORF Transcript_3401/g.5104 Transcript_3401/m.5104 type:complete len:239 (+) Transcript_3401:263-979(+)